MAYLYSKWSLIICGAVTIFLMLVFSSSKEGRLYHKVPSGLHQVINRMISHGADEEEAKTVVLFESTSYLSKTSSESGSKRRLKDSDKANETASAPHLNSNLFVKMQNSITTESFPKQFNVSREVKLQPRSLLSTTDKGSRKKRVYNPDISPAHDTRIEGGNGELKTPNNNLDNPRNPSVSVEDMYHRLVFVSAFSDNHFKEAREMLRTVTECLPETTIIIYDLGLNNTHQKALCTYNNVELRHFPFWAYRPHVRHLRNYAWKPLIVKQVSSEYDIIMYGDSSVRLISCNITTALQHLLEFPFFGNPILSKAVQFAHDGMIRYLQFPKRRRDMKDVASIMGGCWLMWATYEMKMKLIEPLVDCALNEDCIAPFGSQISGCNMSDINDGSYAGCHRYDQSALNLILAREFGLDHFSRNTNRTIAKSIWAVKRI